MNDREEKQHEEKKALAGNGAAESGTDCDKYISGIGRVRDRSGEYGNGSDGIRYGGSKESSHL